MMEEEEKKTKDKKKKKKEEENIIQRNVGRDEVVNVLQQCSALPSTRERTRTAIATWYSAHHIMLSSDSILPPFQQAASERQPRCSSC